MSLFGMLSQLYCWHVPWKGRSPPAMADRISAQFLHETLVASNTKNRNDAGG